MNKTRHEPDRIYTGAEELGKRLGVHPRTVFRNKLQIPHKIIGNKMVASESVLQDWLAGRLEWPPVCSQETNQTNQQPRRPGRPTKADQIARRNTTGGAGRNTTGGAA